MKAILTLLLLSLLVNATPRFGDCFKKVITVTTGLTSTITTTITAFTPQSTAYESPLVFGPLHTCYETITSAHNWFTVAWESGDGKDRDMCKRVKKSIKVQKIKLSEWECSWYFDSTVGRGITRAHGYLRRQEGVMDSALEITAGELWGDDAVRQCRLD